MSERERQRDRETERCCYHTHSSVYLWMLLPVNLSHACARSPARCNTHSLTLCARCKVVLCQRSGIAQCRAACFSFHFIFFVLFCLFAILCVHISSYSGSGIGRKKCMQRKDGSNFSSRNRCCNYAYLSVFMNSHACARIPAH